MSIGANLQAGCQICRRPLLHDPAVVEHDHQVRHDTAFWLAVTHAATAQLVVTAERVAGDGNMRWDSRCASAFAASEPRMAARGPRQGEDGNRSWRQAHP